MITDNTLDAVRKERVTLSAIAKKHGAHNLRIFGSVVRDEDVKGSDIDLLVDIEEGRSLLDLLNLEDELSKHLGRRVEVVTESSLNKHIRERILLEAQSL